MSPIKIFRPFGKDSRTIKLVTWTRLTCLNLSVGARKYRGPRED